MKTMFNNQYKEILIEQGVLPKINGFDVLTIDDFLDMEDKAGNTLNIKLKSQLQPKFESFISNILHEADYEPEISDVDIEALKKAKLSGDVSKGVDIAKRPEKMLHKSNIVDENGNVIDDDVLKKKITQRPKKIISQNTKLKKSGKKAGSVYFDLTLPSYMGLYVDEKTGEFKVVKTCPSAGECSKFCYAAKGGYVMFPGSSLGASRVVNFLMNDPEGFKSQVLSELASANKSLTKKKMTLILRWHDSGDFLSENYLQLAFDIAKQTPNILHYAYTKQVPLVKKLNAIKPENFVFNFSFGGLHDTLIDPLVDKHSRVVPYILFKDLPHDSTETGIIFPDISIQTLKNRVAKEYSVKVDSIITYDELIEKPVGSTDKWNVLVWKGHGDDAASRKDVLGTYLLFH